MNIEHEELPENNMVDDSPLDEYLLEPSDDDVQNTSPFGM